MGRTRAVRLRCARAVRLRCARAVRLRCARAVPALCACAWGRARRVCGVTTTPIATLEPLTGGGHTVLMGSLADIDVAAAGYEQSEWRCSGVAASHAAPGALGVDGRWSLSTDASAEFATRVVVRQPSDPMRSSGVMVLEWLNVSSGTDAAPVFGFAGPEIVRAGHTWVGVSAQWAGIVPAPALVDIGGPGLVALQEADPERYGSLHHPGDAFSFDLFTQVANALVATGGSEVSSPLHGLGITTVLAVGESQSAYALSTYANGMQPLSERFDGFLIHSRGGPVMGLGEPGRGADLDAGRDDPAVLIRTDLDVPVLVLQTETDVIGHLYSLPSRQPDTARIRTWEVAGAAHADHSMVGDYERFLGCGQVNRGQQRFVVRAALRHLVAWGANGSMPPHGEPLVVEGDPADGRRGLRFGVDDVGNVLGGVRTPSVDAPAEVLSGLSGPGASRACMLFGRRLPAPADVLAARYPGGTADYLTAYERATDAAIDAGFILAEDRSEVLADAHPELIAP